LIDRLLAKPQALDRIGSSNVSTATPLTVLMLADSSSYNSPSLWVNGTQLVSPLRDYGCNLVVSEAFPRGLARAVSAVPGVRRLFWKGLLPVQRARQLERLVRGADVVIVHKSITHIQDEPLLERRLRKLHNRIIFNFDDATHERGIPYLDERLSLADAAWVGNPLLVDFARNHCPRVELIESAVDCDRYRAKSDYAVGKPLRLCWSGTPSSYGYLDLLREPLRHLGKRIPYQITVMGRNRFSFQDPEITDRWVPFSHAGEVELFQSSDIGLMPLPDGPYERAKENYKTKIYMASGLPVVASPVGMNTKFIAHGERGMLAATPDEWIEAILQFADSTTLRQQSGRAARQFMLTHYSTSLVAERLAQFFRSLGSDVSGPEGREPMVMA
jgi:glycosyltransferase involved in cell wall biosynthesis